MSHGARRVSRWVRTPMSDGFADLWERIAAPGLTQERLLKTVSAGLKDLGYDAFVFSLLPRDPEDEPVILLDGWPMDWAARYDEAQHHRHDPLARHCRSTLQPFTWTEIPQEYLKDRRAAVVSQEARLFGLVQGLCAPVHSPAFSGGLSIAGREADQRAWVRRAASLVAVQISRQVGCLRLPEDTRRLTGREIDVLTWVATGATYQAIADRLALSVHTVAEHLKNIRRKLHTANNAQSFIRAWETGQLQL